MRAKADAEMPKTTLIDFLYRVRLRCNYREVSPFIHGAWADADVIDFLETVCAVTSYALAWAETLVCGRIGTTAVARMLDEFLALSTYHDLDALPMVKRWRVTNMALAQPTGAHQFVAAAS